METLLEVLRWIAKGGGDQPEPPARRFLIRRPDASWVDLTALASCHLAPTHTTTQAHWLRKAWSHYRNTWRGLKIRGQLSGVDATPVADVDCAQP